VQQRIQTPDTKKTAKVAENYGISWIAIVAKNSVTQRLQNCWKVWKVQPDINWYWINKNGNKQHAPLHCTDLSWYMYIPSSICFSPTFQNCCNEYVNFQKIKFIEIIGSVPRLGQVEAGVGAGLIPNEPVYLVMAVLTYCVVSALSSEQWY